jgi:hypothetical protein
LYRQRFYQVSAYCCLLGGVALIVRLICVTMLPWVYFLFFDAVSLC